MTPRTVPNPQHPLIAVVEPRHGLQLVFGPDALAWLSDDEQAQFLDGLSSGAVRVDPLAHVVDDTDTVTS